MGTSNGHIPMPPPSEDEDTALRDGFALAFAVGLTSSPGWDLGSLEAAAPTLARLAYVLADAAIVARRTSPTPPIVEQAEVEAPQ